ncbi:MAG: serine protein kinase RIO [Methanosarcinales archaeon Met12]|nr:MAG: serine protein kinase RIO [Methanosarcinales archaeon Met12]
MCRNRRGCQIRRAERLRIRIKDSDDLKVEEGVFDVPTLKALYRLSNKKFIRSLGGVMSTGKEANVFHALDEKGEIAVKIYRITTSDFRAMQEYITGDPRFKSIKHDKKDIVIAWTKKELRNLMRAHDAGVRVPMPIISERNVLVMEFIGKDGIHAPLLKEVASEIEDPVGTYEKITEYMRLLYHKAGLVHADLSEYNIMYYGEPIFIDMGQSVLLSHPHAEEFFVRDVGNIVRFFRKLGVECSEEGLIAEIKRGGKDDPHQSAG